MLVTGSDQSELSHDRVFCSRTSPVRRSSSILAVQFCPDVSIDAGPVTMAVCVGPIE